MTENIYLYIFLMALVTYLIRALPLTLVRRQVKSPFMQAFLHYVPFACLAAMTFPAILDATGNQISGTVAFAVALVAVFFRRSLLTVALLASAAAFLTELMIVVL